LPSVPAGFSYMRFLGKFRLYANFGQKWGKYMQFCVKISRKWWLVPFLIGREGKNLAICENPSKKLAPSIREC
jgi:hypothetical protein